MDSLVQQIIDVAGPAHDRATHQKIRGVLDVYSVTKGRYYATWRSADGTVMTQRETTLEKALRSLIFALSAVNT